MISLVLFFIYKFDLVIIKDKKSIKDNQIIFIDCIISTNYKFYKRENLYQISDMDSEGSP